MACNMQWQDGCRRYGLQHSAAAQRAASAAVPNLNWFRGRSALNNRALQLHASMTDAMKRKHTRVASLPDCLEAAVLALVPFKQR